MIIFCHGGGWFAGNLDTEDRTCRMACGNVPAWVVSVDYRCNLDVKMEDEVDDCVKAFEWAFGRAEAHGVDPKRIIVWGGSAGGCDRVISGLCTLAGAPLSEGPAGQDGSGAATGDERLHLLADGAGQDCFHNPRDEGAAAQGWQSDAAGCRDRGL